MRCFSARRCVGTPLSFPLLSSSLWSSRAALHTSLTCRSATTTTAAAAEEAERSKAEEEKLPEELIVGNTKCGVRSNLDFVYRRSHFVGEDFHDTPPRADAGDLMAHVDTAAVRAGFYFIQKYVCDGPFKVLEDMSMVTSGLNSFTFSKPIYNGDLIQLENRVIHASGASLAVYTSAHRQSYDCPTPQLVGESFLSMVVVDPKDLKTKKGKIPAVRLTDPADIRRNMLYLKVREETKRLNASTMEGVVLDPEAIELPQNKVKHEKIPMCDTVTDNDRAFGVKDMNANKVIYGGAILRVMEQAALHCGRVFSQRPHVHTIGMFGMTFDSPLFFREMSRSRCHVTCVGNTTMMVHVTVHGEFHGERRLTNTATFLLVAVDTNGRPSPIAQGLDLTQASQEELHEYKRSRDLMVGAAKDREKYGGSELLA